jgi:hypothetical protein
MRIGIDVEGVLADSITAILPKIERDLGLVVRKDEFSHWKYGPELPYSSTRMFLGWLDEAFNKGEVELEEPNVVDYLKSLREYGHEITIISNRTFNSHVSTLSWLHEQGFHYDNVILGNGDKLTYPIDVLVDDAPKWVETVRYFENLHLYLRTQPWNSAIGIDDEEWFSTCLHVTRVDTFKDFMSYVMKGESIWV